MIQRREDEIEMLHYDYEREMERNKFKLKFGERSFSLAGPADWNSLPTSLQEITNTETFKRHLKTHLFRLSYT